MKKLFLLTALLLSACGASEKAVQTAIAQTEAAQSVLEPSVFKVGLGTIEEEIFSRGYLISDILGCPLDAFPDNVECRTYSFSYGEDYFESVFLMLDEERVLGVMIFYPSDVGMGFYECVGSVIPSSWTGGIHLLSLVDILGVPARSLYETSDMQCLAGPGEKIIGDIFYYSDKDDDFAMHTWTERDFGERYFK